MSEKLSFHGDLFRKQRSLHNVPDKRYIRTGCKCISVQSRKPIMAFHDWMNLYAQFGVRQVFPWVSVTSDRLVRNFRNYSWVVFIANRKPDGESEVFWHEIEYRFYLNFTFLRYICIEVESNTIISKCDWVSTSSYHNLWRFVIFTLGSSHQSSFY